MSTLLIKNGTILNEGKLTSGSLFCRNGIIEKIIFNELSFDLEKEADKIIDASGNIVMPGVIDDQVHFREPGLTHKGNIYSESKAAVAGGITSFMEMPNTLPPAITIDQLNEKFKIAEKSSFANYSFYLGATNDNITQLLKADPARVCGIKIFMGSSTGNMLVDNKSALKTIFSQVKLPIAVHCEDEETIKTNIEIYKNRYGEDIPIEKHPEIRSEEACYKSSSYAVKLAKELGTRLHVLHISTAKELDLFNTLNEEEKTRITSEVCIHHLWFDESDYDKHGSKIKWNPAIKKESDKNALIKAVADNRITVVATDHAPHTLEEKSNSYLKSPSGGPMVQHSLVAMFELAKMGKFTVQTVVEKMCHSPATLFNIDKRGFIREGYHADITIIDTNSPFEVTKNNILYKCGWSPMEGVKFSSKVKYTIINGNIVYSDDKIHGNPEGMELRFNRS